MNTEQVVVSPFTSTVATLTDALIQGNCRVERSFDLRQALANDAQCECDYAVLYIYEEAGEVHPAVVIAHGYGGSTWLYFRTDQSGKNLASRLEAALEDVLNASLNAADVAGFKRDGASYRMVT